MPIPQRPPNSGKGSGVQAWREYAAALTDTPIESWEGLVSREDVHDLLVSEGVIEPPEDDASSEEDNGEGKKTRRRPVWMVPTEDGGYEPER